MLHEGDGNWSHHITCWLDVLGLEWNNNKINTPISILFTSSNVDPKLLNTKPFHSMLTLILKSTWMLTYVPKTFDQIFMTHKINLINQWRVNCIKEVLKCATFFLNPLCMK